ncbi:MAG: ATP-binding protein [Chloroflexota bacterium]
MHSLSYKFTFVLVLVSLVGIAFVAIYASQATQKEFASFLFGQDQKELLTKLGEIYRSNGSWNNIDQSMLRTLSGNQKYGIPFAVVNIDGIVVITSPRFPLDTQVSQADISSGIPISVEGKTVGIIISSAPRVLPLKPIIENFSKAINHSLILGGLIAVGVSLLLGVILSLSLTRRLRVLSKAAHAIAKGELTTKVIIESKDEIGELALAFNQMSADLERSRELRRQMTADIAHELRTPLSIILGRAETLADGMLPPTQEVFKVIHQESLRVNRLVEDMRLLSLSDAGELPLEKRTINVCQLLEEITFTYRVSAQQKGITLLSENTDNLPSILADPDRIKQIFANIIENALRYTTSGGCIQLSARAEAQGVVISVKDNGIGIQKDDIPYLFDRFYRSDKTRDRDKGGTGLGLAIVNSLVNAHNGKISVISQPGEGTTFFVWLAKS